MSLPALASPVPQQFFDGSGAPLSGGKVTTVRTGTAILAHTATTYTLSLDNANPLTLDSAGRANIFLYPGIVYDFIVQKADLTPVVTIAGIEDVVSTQLPILGNTFATGSFGVSPGFQVTTEALVTVNSSSAGSSAAQLLLPAATRGNQLTVQNIGTSQVALIPAGSDTINQLSATVPLLLPPATAQYIPTAICYPNGTSNWRVNAPQFLNPVQGVTAGIRVNSGHVTLDGSNPTSWPHGLTTCTDATVSIKASTISGSGLGLSLVTYVVNGANIDVYAWRPANSGDATLVASNDNTTAVSIIAYGT